MNVERERALNKIVRDAVSGADRVIMDASSGSVEETDWLTARMALEFMQKVEMAAMHRVLRTDLTQATLVADMAVKIADVLRDGVEIDGAHHKQWALEQVAEAMGVTLPDHKEGIAP